MCEKLHNRLVETRRNLIELKKDFEAVRDVLLDHSMYLIAKDDTKLWVLLKNMELKLGSL